MKNPNDMKSLKVICVKTFTFNNITYTENSKYHLIIYDTEKFFYIYEEKIKKQTYPTPFIDIKYRNNFVTEKELRKLKLKKLNE